MYQWAMGAYTSSKKENAAAAGVAVPRNEKRERLIVTGTLNCKKQLDELTLYNWTE